MKSSAEPASARWFCASVLLGAASGMRSTAGLAAIMAQSNPDLLPAPLRHGLTRPAARVAIAVELVLDKMPFTGSRLDPVGIASRLVFAAAAGGLAARPRAGPVVPAALVAMAAAAGTAKLAHDVRERLAERVPDPAVA